MEEIELFENYLNSLEYEDLSEFLHNYSIQDYKENLIQKELQYEQKIIEEQRIESSTETSN